MLLRRAAEALQFPFASAPTGVCFRPLHAELAYLAAKLLVGPSELSNAKGPPGVHRQVAWTERETRTWFRGRKIERMLLGRKHVMNPQAGVQRGARENQREGNQSKACASPARKAALSFSS